MDFDVVVIGSINYDISVFAPRLPRPGETLLGSGHFFGPGGKGANQAVAVARLGATVGLIGRVGDDDFGVSLVEGLAGEGVDVSAVGVDNDAATGVAVITIDEAAENTIVGSSGANMKLMPDHIADHAGMIAGAKVVLSQLEIPLDTVEAVGQIVTGIFVLNPAPARQLSVGLLDRVDVLVPNRSELSLMASIEHFANVDEVVSAARSMRPLGPTVITLGSEGAVVVGDGDDFDQIAAFEVNAVDPTGAGDAFCGALAFSLSRGRSLQEAASFASAAGALAVGTPGAQVGMPHLGDVEALLAV